MQRFALILALLALTACGFHPVHSKAYKAQQKVDLTNVRIVVDTSRLGQLLKAEIEDGVNPDFETAEKKYTLQIALTERDLYLFVNPDGTAGRGDVEFDSKYVLKRSSNNEVLQSGEIKRVSSYNISETADYATYVSESDARKRGVVELGQDYKLRLSNMLATVKDNQ